MTREELIDRLSEHARHRTRSRSAVWWNGELIPVEEALARAAELQDGDEIQIVQGEVIVTRHLDGVVEVHEPG